MGSPLFIRVRCKSDARGFEVLNIQKQARIAGSAVFVRDGQQSGEQILLAIATSKHAFRRPECPEE